MPLYVQLATTGLLPSTSRLGGPIIGWCGDSITDGTGASNVVFSFVQRAPIYAGGLAISPASIEAGVPGDDSGDLLARMDSIIANDPQVLFILIGTNDNGANSIATYQANIIAIKAKADAAGLPIAFGTVPPRGTGATTGQQAYITAQNLWLRTWAAAQGCPVADVFTALVDPTTGLMAAAYDSGDHIHPNDDGHTAIAAEVSPVVAALVERPVWPVTTATAGLVTDPLAAAASGWTNWDVAAGFVVGMDYSNVAAVDGDLPAGQWLRLTVPNASGGTTNSNMRTILDPAKWSAGDKLAVFCYARGSHAGALNKVQLINPDSGAALAVNIDSPPTSTPGPIAFAYTVPSSGTPSALALSIVCQAPAGQTRYVDIGAFDVFNLTDLGIDLSL